MPSGPRRNSRLCVRRGASVFSSRFLSVAERRVGRWPSPPARRTPPAQAPGPRIQNNRQAGGRRGRQAELGPRGLGTGAARGLCAGRGILRSDRGSRRSGSQVVAGSEAHQPGGSSRRPRSFGPPPNGGSEEGPPTPPATGPVGTGAGVLKVGRRGTIPFEVKRHRGPAPL